MTARNVWVAIAGALWLCIVGVIGGVVVDRSHIHGRHAAIVAQLDQAADDLNAQLAPREARWEASVRAVSEALVRGDRDAAERAWREAWSAARAARRWEGLAAVGDAALRMGENALAREAFLTTLFRARDEHSVAGVLRAEEAFETLGDHAMARQCLRVAESMPGIDDVERGLLRLRAARRIHSRAEERAVIGHASGPEIARTKVGATGGSSE